MRVTTLEMKPTTAVGKLKKKTRKKRPALESRLLFFKTLS